MMHKTEIVATADQIHACLKRSKTTSRMTRFARQTRQSFSKGSIQSLNKRRVENGASSRGAQQLFCLLGHAKSDPSGDLHDPLSVRPFDDCADVQLRPDLQTRSSHSSSPLDLLSERSTNTLEVSTPPIGQNEKRAQADSAAANLRHQGIGQPTITRALDHSCDPQARRNHHGQSHPREHLALFHPNFIGL